MDTLNSITETIVSDELDQLVEDQRADDREPEQPGSRDAAGTPTGASADKL